MTKKSTLLYVILVLFHTFANAQVIRDSAYIVQENGDTIKGRIEVKDWKYTPQELYFASNQKPSEILKMNTQNIKGFGYENHHFVKSFIEWDDMEIAILSDSFGVRSSYRSQAPVEITYFVERIEEGKNVNLYEFTDNKTTRFLVGIPYRWSNSVYFYTLGQVVPWIYHNGQLAPFNSFQRQLKQICFNSQLVLYKQFYKIIEQCRYERKDLLKIIKKINTFKSSSS